MTPIPESTMREAEELTARLRRTMPEYLKGILSSEDVESDLNEAADAIAELRRERDEAKAEVSRYWTSADIKPWCDLAESKGLGHFGKKLKGMFSRAMKAEDDARIEYDRAEAAEARVARLEAALRNPTDDMLDKACVAWAKLHPEFEGEKPQPTSGEVVATICKTILDAALDVKGAG